MSRKTSSFTLIELLIVIAIIGILSGLILFSVTNAQYKAQNAKLLGELVGISKSLDTFYNMNRSVYPTGNFCIEDTANSSEFLTLLNVTSPVRHPDYVDDATHLTTNNCFLYSSDGTNYSIRVHAKGSQGYLIQESRGYQTKELQTEYTCGTGWIPFGNKCIMKYEAKNVSTVPTSQAAETPWVSITQTAAKTACESIGAHLITNAEWMALARDIESVSSNYVSGVLKRGNVGDSSTGDYAGDEPEYGTGRNTLAELTLSNGQTIWDLSGNVWEWVDGTVSTQAGMLPNKTTFGWEEIANITDWGSTNLYYAEVGPFDSSLVSTDGVGRIYYKSSDSTARAFMRGGRWDSGSDAGAFAFAIEEAPSGSSTDIGFRCVK